MNKNLIAAELLKMAKRMMSSVDEDMIDASPEDQVIYIADEVGGDLVTDYSGRSMYGKTCYGIEHNRTDDVQKLAENLGLGKGRIDNMGLRYIIYWPQVKGD
jgi:hypothetical protein